MTWRTDIRLVLATLFGLANAIAGGYFLHEEMHTPPSHSGHVYLFAGWIAVGCLIAAPSLMFGALKQAITALKLLSEVRVGGDRKTDPPAP